MLFIINTLIWIILLTTPANCRRPAGEENKTLATSSDTFEHKSQSRSEDFNDDWSELRSAEQMGAANGNRRIRPSPADHRRIRMKPADDLKPADSPQDDVSIKFTKKQSKTNRNSAMRIILKRNLENKKRADEDKAKPKPPQKPPRFRNNGKYNLKMMKPSIHTIIACITVMMVVFHIIICLGVWQQCKTRNEPPRLLEPGLTVQTAPTRARPRHTGEQSFSVLLEEPPLVGEVPLPPDYKEGERTKPPSYDNIGSENDDHTRAM